jgi:hypothetical protein
MGLSVGTKSLLFGAHQFVLHPLAVYICWVRLYHRLPTWWETICILVHDWGYWGCLNMDGERGTNHPGYGARVAYSAVLWIGCRFRVGPMLRTELALKAANLCSGHSRHYARQERIPVSKLCRADKWGAVLWPWWIYLPMTWASGELEEYRQEADRYHRETGKGCSYDVGRRGWYRWLKSYLIGLAKMDGDLRQEGLAASRENIRR